MGVPLLLLLLVLSPWPHPFVPECTLPLVKQSNDDMRSASELLGSTASFSCSKLASAQGLSVPDESLGAGELAALDLFGMFEGLLELSDDFTGGRGRGGKGGTGRKRAAFQDTQSLRQQQLELYHVAGSPQVYHSFNSSQTSGGRNYLPKLRDQGQCSTCVGHAVASAAEASVASTLRVDAIDWDVSPQSMYYCSAGGKTCASGWQIEEALYDLQNHPEIIRPSSCTGSNLVEPEIGSWTGVCAAAANKCPITDNSLPWMSCSFKALSSFWQIQQDIRQHGAVITRITIYDDFTPFFDPSKTGLENGIYRPQPGARKLYGHAVTIVGYDNVNMAWTLLNSWGTRSTKDGLFRIAMGQAGVGAPDASYSVSCEPRAGTYLDPHEYKPWRWDQRKPVRLVNPEADRTNLTAACYYYDAVPGDTASSVADAFLLDIRKFAQDNTQVFKPVEVTADFNASLTAAQLTAALTNVRSLQQFPVTAEPYFRCTDSTGDVQECRSDLVEPCSGINNCTLVYQEPDVFISPASQVLRVCNISLAVGQFEAIAQFEDPYVSQPRALRRLLDAMGYTDVPVPIEYCDENAWTSSSNPRAEMFGGRWVQDCEDGWITHFEFEIGIADDPNVTPLLDQSLAQVLLILKKVRRFTIIAAPGSIIPPQLGALNSIDFFITSSWCFEGELPGNLGIGWPNISTMAIREDSARRRTNCGIQGTLPVLWGTTMPNLRKLEISSTRLSGTLPPEYSQMTQLQDFYVYKSSLSGVLPSSYAEWKIMRSIDLSSNELQGPFPTAWSAFRYRLLSLNLKNNAGLKGCIPLTAYTTIEYDGTGMTGLCTDNKQEIEQQQADALRNLLIPLLNADDEEWPALKVTTQKFIEPISIRWGGEDGEETFTFTTSDSRGSISFTLRMSNGVVYISSIVVKGAGLDLRVLPDLVAALPQLERFVCLGCDCNRQDKAAMQLPAALAAKAPKSLTTLELPYSQVQGALPAEWGTWFSLTQLDLTYNSITGTLPASWKDMSSIDGLFLALNFLVGTLPPEWGSGGISRASVLTFSRNSLTGTIPLAWNTFKGGFYLYGSGVSGCIPDQLWTNVFWENDYIPCSQNSSDVTSLLTLRRLLDPNGTLLASWNRTNSKPTYVPGSVPGHCRKFLGVGCNNLNKVSSLDLAQLCSRGFKTKMSFNQLLQALAQFSDLQVLKLSGCAGTFSPSKSKPQVWMRFKSLQHLDLSSCGLSGRLSPSLAGAYNLQYLNLSGNAGLTGPLPELWGGLTKLQVLDVSGCGVKGALPNQWASMQQLREFRASRNRPGLSGTLPESWGMLRNLVVLEVNHAGLTGSLPVIWADPLAMAAQAAVMLATARRHVTNPSITVPGLSSAESQQLAKAAAEATMATLEQVVNNQGSGKLGMLQLQQLSLSGNKLQGQLPVAFAAMQGLQQIRLDGNMLNGPLPVAWAALGKLQVLDISFNRLSGPLPDFWGTIARLEVVNLSHNPLSGSLPSPWGGLARLRHLDLSSCGLNGNLPAAWFGLREVHIINLSGNLLDGKLPSHWGVMGDRGSYELRIVDLSHNPCMEKGPLLDSIKKSGITTSGRVTVNTTGVGLGGPGCA